MCDLNFVFRSVIPKNGLFNSLKLPRKCTKSDCVGLSWWIYSSTIFFRNFIKQNSKNTNDNKYFGQQKKTFTLRKKVIPFRVVNYFPLENERVVDIDWYTGKKKLYFFEANQHDLLLQSNAKTFTERPLESLGVYAIIASLSIYTTQILLIDCVLIFCGKSKALEQQFSFSHYDPHTHTHTHTSHARCKIIILRCHNMLFKLMNLIFYDYPSIIKFKLTH